jgi:hypothetical protein
MAGRAKNTHRRGNWCSQPECRCYKLDRAGDSHEIDVNREEHPCLESVMFKRWSFGPGGYSHGSKKGEPIPILHAKEGKLAFLTSKNCEMREDQRIVIGAYEIGEIGRYPYGHYAIIAKQNTHVQLSVVDSDRAPRFWEFYQNSAGPPAWRSGLFRYLTAEQATAMFDALKSAASGRFPRACPL